MRVVREYGSEFAYPSTSLYVESTPESVDNAIPALAQGQSELAHYSLML